MSAATAAPKATTFFGNIVSYDVHTYYNYEDLEEQKFARELYRKVEVEFADLIEKGDVRIFKFWEYPIGPHPISMFEIDFKTVEAFIKVIPFYQVNHGPLSVLIHPRSDKGALTDHTEHALWLGEKQPLKLGVLLNDVGED
ncbi:hypothetical protein BABINDRAFT_33500 [Babjeviella inositovora NRRL Y-12698]|uniref:DOPA 4,5-dioxygenase n=1 Tax=Babjeviella inositovora NRRL Y-12698 TaxID=984486 RepID=A0A1E3QTE4_9ASCO|nr:uncharacterized protein BABINDRAFT_33500 [Babjeviella inositovora NRRL Y-12698]ODQ80966.1 hypothetical protein BABINDRAFT_33500 [Babjeviella inositovora NRRL Y-12698]